MTIQSHLRLHNTNFSSSSPNIQNQQNISNSFIKLRRGWGVTLNSVPEPEFDDYPTAAPQKLIQLSPASQFWNSCSGASNPATSQTNRALFFSETLCISSICCERQYGLDCLRCLFVSSCVVRKVDVTEVWLRAICYLSAGCQILFVEEGCSFIMLI